MEYEREKAAILGEEYADYFLDFPTEILSPCEDLLLVPLDDTYTLAYSKEPVWQRGPVSGENPVGYSYIPGVYGLMDEMEAFTEGTAENEMVAQNHPGTYDDTAFIISGIKRVQRPPLELTGKDCVICVIDTGIDYRLDDFKDANGDTRILAIWDQKDQRGTPPQGFFYGSLYEEKDIQKQLPSENEDIQRPFGEEEWIVPMVEDMGHGTNMALLAAGKKGAAPDAKIVVVRLKECKNNLRQYYRIPEGVPAFEGNDIAQAIKFGNGFAKVFQRPVIFCLGIGTSMGDHGGNSFLADYMKRVGKQRNRCMVVCGGNEGNSAHHFMGNISNREKHMDVELKVGGEEGFCLEFWGNQPDLYRITVISPSGESIPMAGLGMYDAGIYGFVYEETLITVESILAEAASGKELIRFRFSKPRVGIWILRVEAAGTVYNGTFHMWLPIERFLHEETYFLRPNPTATVTEPGMNDGLLTVGSYNDENESLSIESGRGFNTDIPIKPDLVAPGIRLPGKVGSVSGSSFSAAIAAGAAAQFMEWAVVRKNSLLADTTLVKNYLIQGAKRKPAYSYPNREWGYGALNLQGVFDVIAGING